MDPVPESVSPQEAGDQEVSRPLGLALGLTVAAVIVVGVFPGLLAFFGEATEALIAGP